MLYHCCISREGLAKEVLNGNTILADQTGRALTEQEHLAIIREMREKNISYFSGCDNVDKDGRCAGHPN